MKKKSLALMMVMAAAGSLILSKVPALAEEAGTAETAVQEERAEMQGKQYSRWRPRAEPVGIM